MCKAYRPAPLRRHAACPAGRALEIVGDRWSLLVVDDLLHAPRSYGELLASLRGIATNVLADRLARLQRAGLVRRAPPRRAPPRGGYELTPKGRDLAPVVEALAAWAARHRPVRAAAFRAGNAQAPRAG